jgi:hypothetical protein
MTAVSFFTSTASFSPTKSSFSQKPMPAWLHPGNRNAKQHTGDRLPQWKGKQSAMLLLLSSTSAVHRGRKQRKLMTTASNMGNPLGRDAFPCP